MNCARAREKRGSVRPAVLALAVIVATAVVVVGRTFLTRGRDQNPDAGPPIKVTEPHGKQHTPVPSAQIAVATGTRVQPPPSPDLAAGAFLWDDFAAKDPFAGGRWVATRDGDFAEAVTDIVGGRLRVRVGTIGTRDDTVKHLGIRSATAVVDCSSPVEVAAEIDWNNQANGCYLEASLFLCPTSTDTTAANEKDWLRFEYVGVPPGRNARACLSRRQAGNLRFLYTEGWPQPDPKDRVGRPIGRQNVRLRLDRQNIEIIENGKTLWGPEPHGCDFSQAFLYLDVCSHSNYPPRELFFDNVVVRPAPRSQ